MRKLITNKTKQTSMIFEDDLLNNKTSPYSKTINVAVLSADNREFEKWVWNHGFESENYIRIDSIDKARGIVFDRIEKLNNCHLIPNINQILELLEKRLKQ